MEKYHVALSLKPDAVGWAVLDDNFNLKKVYPFGNKNSVLAIGADKFTPGSTAAETRAIRSNRRRLSRRKKRIGWLNDIFEPYLQPVDPTFLRRLKESSLAGSDKKFSGGIIFNDEQKEKDFYKKYPTVFHLICDLSTSDKQADLRLIYLAIHNIVKYRGHFNNKTPMASFSTESINYDTLLSDIQSAFNNSELGSLVVLNTNQGEQMRGILLDKSLGKKEQKRQLQSILLGSNGKINKKIVNELIKSICGSKFSIDTLLQLDQELGIKLSFEDEDIDEQLTVLDDSLTSEQQTILSAAHQIYLGISLEKLVPNGKTFSQAQVDTYNLYHKQYKVLVSFRKQLTDPKDNQAIRSILNQYASPDYQEKGHISRETFYEELQRYLKKLPDSPQAKQISQWIADNSFMVKPRDKKNQLIPRQLHQYELDQIIEHQGKYYPFLKELNPRKDRRKDAKYKLDELVAFRLPYYVGPLVDNAKTADGATSRFSWVNMKNNGEDITPWNIDQKVDFEKTANTFIRHLTAKDSLILSEDVMPSSAILYQKFNVLNELNKVRVDGNLLRPGDKQKIFNDLFRSSKSVSVSKFKRYLKTNYGYLHDPEITGLANKKSFNTSYSTYIDFKRIIGDKVDNPDYQQDLDKIVAWSTIFPKGPIYRHKLNEINWLNSSQKNKISNLHYSGWGRYSRKTLAGLVNDNGERIIDIMWNTNLNFAQVASKPDFKKQIAELNADYINGDESFDEMLDSSYTSPQNKKAIRQAIYVLNDIVKKMGHAPETVSLQFMRYNQPNKVTQSRAKILSNLYKNITRETARNYFSDKQLLSKELKSIDNINYKIYLYFLQFGRDMYSGLQINIDDLLNYPSNYKVVHVLPPTFINDDSLNNKVLIKSDTNYSNMGAIRNSRRNFWIMLQSMGLLTNAKMRNLMQDTKAIGRGAREGFARRSLTANSQIIKLAAAFISNHLKETKVIEVRNELIDQLKQKLQIFPRVIVNDYHYGLDAYFTGIAGLYLYKAYPQLEYFFVYGSYPYNVKDLNGLKGFNFLYHILRKSDDFVIPNTDSISVNELNHRMLALKDAKRQIITNQPIENHGAAFKQTIFPHQDYTNHFIAIKKGRDPKIYGGYKTPTSSFMSLVRVKLAKGGHHFRLIMVPRTVSDQLNFLIQSNKQKAQKLIIELAKDSAPAKEKGGQYSVEIFKVFPHQMIELDGAKAVLGSATTLWNADQLILSKESLATLAEQYNGELDMDPKRDEKLVAIYDEISEKVSKYMALMNKSGVATKLVDARNNFINLPATLSDIQKAKNDKKAKGTNKLMIINDLIYALLPGASRASHLSKIKVKGRVGTTQFSGIMHSGDKVFITSPAGLNNHTYILF